MTKKTIAQKTVAQRKGNIMLVVNNVPRYVRCYDNGGASFHRYTVAFTRRYRKTSRDEYYYLGMSEHPYDPQGFGQHGFSNTPIDRPKYAHLGKRTAFSDLPDEVRKLVRIVYRVLWNIEPGVETA